jgi:hypothetical protein
VAFVSRGRVEAIETMRAGAAMARMVRVRWAASATAITAESLGRVAETAEAALHDVGQDTARFAVASDAMCARLLGALIGAGVPIIEAVPEESRLERLFMPPSSAR